MSYEFLQILWFILIAILWIGFFFLEGFDFGVGMLLPFLGKKDEERRAMINAIGPTWDGNEVWLLTAGGATFAAGCSAPPAAISRRAGTGWSSKPAKAPATSARKARCCSTRRASRGSLATAAAMAARCASSSSPSA